MRTAFCFLFFSSIIVSAQQHDKFRVFIDASVFILPIKLSGTMTMDTNLFPNDPDFLHPDTTTIMAGATGHLGFNIPFYRLENWSLGSKLSLGLGQLANINITQGSQATIFDFPQFVYYRNYKSYFDFSVLVGYKYTFSELPFHLLLAAFDYNIDDKRILRIYGSIIPQKRYNYYINEIFAPELKIREFGISFYKSF